MNKTKYLILLSTILFFACTHSDLTGTTEMENGMAQSDPSTSSSTTSSTDSIASSGNGKSSNSEMSSETANSSSSKKETSSSSEKEATSSSSSGGNGGNGGHGGIAFPPHMGCKPAPLTQIQSYGVVDAFIAKRVEMLVAQGLSNEAAKDSATEELYRELGLDSLFQDRPRITDEQLEYTLFYLYKNKENADENELSPTIVEDFADGGLKPENYCINDKPFASLDRLPYEYLNLGCAIGDEVSNALAILRNIWRKCSNMPYCNESVGDSIYTIGSDHYVCENGSWITLEMLGKEMNGIICTENGTRTTGIGQTNNELTYVCYDEYWRSIQNTSYLSAEEFFNPNFEYGTFTDSRDGHVYKTTVYNGQTWLAQDIDYYDSSDSLFVKQSVCTKLLNQGKREASANAYCDGASRFYTVNVSKKVCPEGWRLPTKEDWNHIEGMEYSQALTYFPKLYVIGSFMQGKGRAATDELGLSLKMNGVVAPYGDVMSLTGYNTFWLEEGVYAMNGDLFTNYANVDPREKGEYVPVRCIKK